MSDIPFILRLQEEAKDYTVEVLDFRYWSGNGIATAVVAIKGIVDWSAYIGSSLSEGMAMRHTLTFVALHGNKLSEENARSFFPHVDLPYRD